MSKSIHRIRLEEIDAEIETLLAYKAQVENEYLTMSCGKWDQGRADALEAISKFCRQQLHRTRSIRDEMINHIRIEASISHG